MKRTFLSLLIASFLLSSGCAWFGPSERAAGPVPERPKITKRQAMEIAQEFVAQEGLGDEFRMKKASARRYLAMGEDRHWIWQVYFPHETQTMMKFYKKSPLMVEVNAVTGEVENWGRR